jgi:hypothetical protein
MIIRKYNIWTSKYKYDVRATRLMEMFDDEIEKHTTKNRIID